MLSIGLPPGLVLLTHTLLVVWVSIWAVVKEVPLLVRKRQGKDLEEPGKGSQGPLGNHPALLPSSAASQGGRGWKGLAPPDV